jgi:hypothetical protein
MSMRRSHEVTRITGTHRAADQRNHLADQRERAADERNHLADQRDRNADARDRATRDSE